MMFHFRHHWVSVKDAEDHSSCGQCFSVYGFCVYGFKVCAECGKVRGGSERGKITEEYTPPRCREMLRKMGGKV